MKQFFKRYSFLLLFFLIVIYFFFPFFIQGLLPIPADTIVGLYHPFRDLYASTNPNGLPFHNFLITDPIRQIYPWRNLAVQILKSGQLPLWNPYQFAGAPLLANFQSSPFYPLNILLFILPFQIGWSFMIILQPILAGLFLYLYLKNLKLSSMSSIFGGLVFALCGFSVAWMEWNTVVQTALWLPLILLSIDKMELGIKNQELWKNRKFQIQNYTWQIIFVFSLICSFFAGHLQSFFYLYLISIVYFSARWIQVRRQIKQLILFLILNSLFIILTSVQWIPTLQFILLSARNVDQSFTQQGWFLPWQNLVQFIIPDFFGNPATLNYWGIWNYGEFIGYIGIIPFVCALFALLFRRDKKTWFFGGFLFISLLFALPNPISILPFQLNIPFLSTAQPTRLMFITDFSMSVLAALGFDYILKKKKGFVISNLIVLCLFITVWIIVLFSSKVSPFISPTNISVSKHNLYLPTILIFISLIISVVILYVKKLDKKITTILGILIILITAFDLVRFAQKFETFSNSQYLYPSTPTLQFLSSHLGNYRIMSTDSQILPPNFATMYKLQSVDGYDPLYLLSYGQLIIASERAKPDISPPFGFNRIITPHNIYSPLINLLGVRYVLSLTDIKSPQFKKIYEEGQTQIYQNIDVLPRAFFVSKTIGSNSPQNSITDLFNPSFNPKNTALSSFSSNFTVGTAAIVSYSPNSVTIQTTNSGNGFLVLTDINYPTWHATIDGKPVKIYNTDFSFRGVVVPSGNHTVEFKDSLF